MSAKPLETQIHFLSKSRFDAIKFNRVVFVGLCNCVLPSERYFTKNEKDVTCLDCQKKLVKQKQADGSAREEDAP